MLAPKTISSIIPNSRKVDPLDSLDLYNRLPANSRNPRSTSLDRLNNLTSTYNQVMSKELASSSLGSTGRLSK